MNRRLAVGLVLLLTGVLSVPQVERLPHAPGVRAQVPCVVTVQGVELTQSIQKSPLSGAGPGPAVTLVAGRRTTARVYVTSTCHDDDVVAWMNIASSPSGGAGAINAEGVQPPITPPTTATELNAVRAADDNRALAFWWRINSLDLSDKSYDIKVYACSLSNVQCNMMYTGSPRARVPATIWSNPSPGVFSLPTQTFVYRKTPRILGFPVKQENPIAGEEPIEPDWARIQPIVADPMIRAMLPLPVTPLPYEVTTAIRAPELIPADGLSGLEKDLWPRNVLYQLLCANDSGKHRSDYLVALTPPDVFGPGDGEGFGGGQAANYVAAVDVAPNPQFRTILAHEVHHAMGFNHTHSTGTTGEIGWDIWKAPKYEGGRVRLGGLTDLIEIADFGAGNDGTRWMSVKNTNDIIEPGTARYDRQNCVVSFGGELEPPDPRPRPDPDPIDFLLVLAHVSDIAPFTPAITSVTAHHGREDVTPLTPDDYAVRLVDAAGTPLYTSGMFLDNTGASIGYSITVPDLPQTQSIELLHLGAVKDSITRTANAPSVTLLTPASSTVVTDSTTVSWAADDADGDTLAYDLYWRPTGSGDAWEAITIGALTTTLTVETKSFRRAHKERSRLWRAMA